MAALEKIRSHGKLIAICVGGALLAFVLGDFDRILATLLGSGQTTIAKINGTGIDYGEFMENRVKSREQFMKLATGRNTLDAQSSNEVRDYCWEQLVRENTVGKFLSEQGIQASDAELVYMIQTGNVTPFMRQAFANPETGRIDEARIRAYMSQTDPESKFIWKTLENELREAREYNKYLSMISQGLYVTKAEVEQEFKRRTQLSDIKYVSVPLSEVADNEVAATESDLKNYYEKNKKRFYRYQETRDIAYVSFDVIPTEEDSAAILKSTNAIKDEFEKENVEDIATFVNSKSDIPYTDYNYSKGEIKNEVLDSLIFNGNQSDFVYGPYVEQGFYRLARFTGFVDRPDSVKVSHILLAFRNPADSLSVKAKADSLMTEIRRGVDFNALAVKVSDDQASARDSGNLNWITEGIGYIPEFKNACFATAKGQIDLVKTNYGYHIIKVTDRTAVKKKAKVGFVSVEIRPSRPTYSTAYAKANEFAGKNRTNAQFEKAIEEEKLIRRIAPNVSANTNQIPGLENSREFVRWAYDEQKSKEVSEVMELGDRYVVASLVGVHPKGIPSFTAVKTQVEAQVVNDLKASKLAEKMQGATSVDVLASQLGKPVQEAQAVNFEMTQIPGIGFEPKVIAAASALQLNQVSAPVKGNNAVYVLQNTSYTPSQQIQPLNYTTDQKQLKDELRYRAYYQIPEAITQMVEIDDRRVKFF